MVIHPPTLFLGFAATIVPFSFAISALWKKKYTSWIKPVMPWSLFAAAVLGLGIIMGAYWAYETLNFGGYWNWDPVENAIYVPWLVLIASIHTMLIYKKNHTALTGQLYPGNRHFFTDPVFNIPNKKRDIGKFFGTFLYRSRDSAGSC
jgi:cytochrome c-type biogenesis protein CcmF